MRQIYSAVLAIIITMVSGCQKEVNYALSNGTGNDNNNNSKPAIFIGTLQGNVIDENDKAAVEVSIKIGNKTAVTDARGYLSRG